MIHLPVLAGTNFRMSSTMTRIAVLLALLIGSMQIAQAADDEILKRLDAIEERLKKLEINATEVKSAEAVNPLDAIKEFTKALSEENEKNKNKKKLNEAENQKYLSILEWSASKGGENLLNIETVKLEYLLKNKSQRKISIVDGTLLFKDKLGKSLVKIRVERDVKLDPQESKVFSGTYDTGFGSDVDRLLVLDKKHVDVTLEIKSLLFEDGDVVKF